MTGKPPFMGATVVETIEKVLKEDPVPPSVIDSSIPRDLETICLQCLAKSPTSRYRSALALAQDLERFQADEPILARRESLVRRAYRKARKRAPGIGSLVLLVVAITTLLWAWFELSANRRLTEITKQFQEGLSVEEFDGSAANDLEKLVERKIGRAHV